MRETYLQIARKARKDAEKLSGRSVIQVGGSIALRAFASRLETEAALPEGVVLCYICQDSDQPITEEDFKAERLQHTLYGPAHRECYWSKLEAMNKSSTVSVA